MEDRARKLIDSGRRDAAGVGAYMASHAIIPDRVIASPSERTRETWKIASGAFQAAPVAASVERLYDATAHVILSAISDIPSTSRALLVVGHNPGLHEVAMMLIASGDIETRERLREKLPTSGLVVIDFALDDWTKLHPKSGRLERFVTPKSLGSAAN